MDLLFASGYQSDDTEEDHESKNKELQQQPVFLRTVPHIDGNWSGFVCIPLGGVLSHHQGFQIFVNSYQEALERKYSNHNSNIKFDTVVHNHSQLDLHISLSKVFYLQSAVLNSFERELRERLRFQHQFSIVLDSESIDDGKVNVEVLVNDERSRTFFSLPVVMGCENIKRLISCADEVLRKYQLAPYYESPKFHVSFASMLGDVSGLDLGLDLDDLDDDFQHAKIALLVNKIKCKLGNTKLLCIDLR